MFKVSAQTLVMAIQAVDSDIGELTKDQDVTSFDSDDAELYMALSKAAEDLKRAYLEAFEQISNLPKYEDIARHT